MTTIPPQMVQLKPIPKRWQRFLEVFGCTPTDNIGFDGCSASWRCKRCGLRILQDSQGNWFRAGLQGLSVKEAKYYARRWYRLDKAHVVEGNVDGVRKVRLRHIEYPGIVGIGEHENPSLAMGIAAKHFFDQVDAAR